MCEYVSEGLCCKFIVSKILSICVRTDRGRGDGVHRKWTGTEKGRGGGGGRESKKPKIVWTFFMDGPTLKVSNCV